MFNYADILYAHDDADINTIMQEYEVTPTRDEASFMKDILNTSDLKPVSHENLIKFMQTYSPITNFFSEHDDKVHTIAQFAYPIQFNSNSDAFKAYVKTNNNKANILKLYKIAQNTDRSLTVDKVFDERYSLSGVPYLAAVEDLNKYTEKYKLQDTVSANVYVRTMYIFMTASLVNGYFMRCLLHLAKNNNVDINACKSDPRRPLIGLFSETDLKTMLNIDLDNSTQLHPKALNGIKSVYIAIYYLYKLSTRACINAFMSRLYTSVLNLHRVFKDSFSLTAIVNILSLESKYLFRCVSYEFPQLFPFYCLGMITGDTLRSCELSDSYGYLYELLWSKHCNIDQRTGINTVASIDSPSPNSDGSPVRVKAVRQSYSGYTTKFKRIRNFNCYKGDDPFETFIQNAPHLKTTSKQFDTQYALVLYVVTLPSQGPRMAMLNISKIPIPADTTIENNEIPISVYKQIVHDTIDVNEIPSNLMIIAASYYNPFVEAVIKTFPMSEYLRTYYATNLRERHVDIYGQRYYFITPSMFSEYYKLYEIAILHAKAANKK
jgi:hypothetical protein